MEITAVPTFQQFMAPRLAWVECYIVMAQAGRDFTRRHEDAALEQRQLSRDIWREPSPVISPNVDCDMSALVTRYHDYPSIETLLDIEAHEEAML